MCIEIAKGQLADVTGSPRFMEFVERMVESLSKGPKQVGGAFICGKFLKNNYGNADDTRQPGTSDAMSR